MNAEMTRTHVVIPSELIAEVDKLVGPRRRSQFLADALRDKLRQLRQRAALEKVAGSLKDVDIPGWESPEAASQWVTKSRREDDKRLEGLSRNR